MIKMISRWYPDFRQYGTSPVERYYVAGHYSGNLSSTAFSPDVLYAVPLVMPYRTRLDRVGIRVLGGAGGAARIGIYNAANNVNLAPSALVFDSGAIDTTATGFNIKQVSWTLEGDKLYWMTLVFNTGGMTIRSIPVAGTYPILGYDASLEAGSSSAGMGWSGSSTFGAMPPTFPDPVVNPSNSGLPAIGYRLAA
jgi:hypothetical protein